MYAGACWGEARCALLGRACCCCCKECRRPKRAPHPDRCLTAPHTPAVQGPTDCTRLLQLRSEALHTDHADDDAGPRGKINAVAAEHKSFASRTVLASCGLHRTSCDRQLRPQTPARRERGRRGAGKTLCVPHHGSIHTWAAQQKSQERPQRRRERTAEAQKQKGGSLQAARAPEGRLKCWQGTACPGGEADEVRAGIRGTLAQKPSIDRAWRAIRPHYASPTQGERESARHPGRAAHHTLTPHTSLPGPRDAKRQELLSQRRRVGAPLTVALLPLCAAVDTQRLWHSLLQAAIEGPAAAAHAPSDPAASTSGAGDLDMVEAADAFVQELSAPSLVTVAVAGRPRLRLTMLPPPPPDARGDPLTYVNIGKAAEVVLLVVPGGSKAGGGGGGSSAAADTDDMESQLEGTVAGTHASSSHSRDPTAGVIDEQGKLALSILAALGLPNLLGLVQGAGASMKQRWVAAGGAAQPAAAGRAQPACCCPSCCRRCCSGGWRTARVGPPAVQACDMRANRAPPLVPLLQVGCQEARGAGAGRLRGGRWAAPHGGGQ